MKKFIPLICLLLFFAGKMAKAQSYELWGTTYWGGLDGNGVIMNITEDSNQYAFSYSFDSITGGFPRGSLIYDSKDSTFYGMTLFYGKDSNGVIFSYNPWNGMYTDLYDFDSTHGAFPYGSLVEDTTKGILYGTTSAGGVHNFGTIFGYTILTNTYTVAHYFDSINGKTPLGNLLLANDTTLYGMTSLGGTYNNGVIFNYNPVTRNIIKLYDFNDSTGMLPSGSLILDSGKLYGMTPLGGANNDGVIFSFNLSTNIYIDLFDFNYANGSNPYGSLLKASNGKLYGMTENGVDSSSEGVIFSFNPDSNTYSVLYVFVDSSGGNPAGSLIQGANGKLYATAQTGGLRYNGVIFSFDTGSNIYTDMYDLDGAVGGNPYSDLVETPLFVPTGLASITKTQFLVFPNPSNGLITIVSPSIVDAIRVTDLLGRVTYTFNPKQNRLSLNLNGEGMYFITLTSGNQTATTKIIISR